MAWDVLGDRVLAVTVLSPVFPLRELDEAREIANILGVEHVVIDVNVMEIEGFTSNPPDRCYICKKDLFSKIVGIAEGREIPCVFEASNLDDTGNYRPGLKAVKELGVRTPLVDAGLTKQEIRLLSRERGFPTWDKPAAACLATRIPYNEPITLEKLEQVGKGEEYLVSLGFKLCRLRHHGSIARIEVPAEEFGWLLEASKKQRIIKRLKKLGFQYVTIDIEGYRSGSLNEELDIC